MTHGCWDLEHQLQRGRAAVRGLSDLFRISALPPDTLFFEPSAVEFLHAGKAPTSPPGDIIRRRPGREAAQKAIPLPPYFGCYFNILEIFGPACKSVPRRPPVRVSVSGAVVAGAGSVAHPTAQPIDALSDRPNREHRSTRSLCKGDGRGARAGDGGPTAGGF